MMTARYREFRKFGHGRVISALHAPTPNQLLAAICAVGLVLGLIL